MMTSKTFFGFLGGLVIIGLVVAGVYLYGEKPQDNKENGDQNGDQISIDTSDWDTYRNEEYGFSLDHPGDWEIYEETDNPVSPRFNIYRPSDDIGEPPYDHHSSDVTHVSVFPEGIPTEGISGEDISSNVSFQVEVSDDRDYVLSDGTAFATKANFVSSPSNWNESGFIFANVPINDLEIECFRDGEAVDEEECNPLMGDDMIRYGSVDKRDRAVQVAILESFHFLEDGSEDNKDEEDNKDDLIRVFEPEKGETVSSPITISGEARGNWYFEADFPVRLEDSQGEVLARHYATAQDDWMTEDFVEFESEFSFEEPETATGTLILEKANPSGLPENDDEFRMPVSF